MRRLAVIAVLVVALAGVALGAVATRSRQPSSPQASSWSLSFVSRSADLTSVSCPAARTCYSIEERVSSGGLPFLGTTNDGRSWTTEHVPLRGVVGSGAPTALACPSQEVCVVLTSFHGSSDRKSVTEALVTSDAGRHWQVRSSLASSFSPTELSCGSVDACVVIGTSGTRRTAYATRDGGTRWTVPSGVSSLGVPWSIWCGRRKLCLMGTWGETSTPVLVSTDEGFAWRRTAVQKERPATFYNVDSVGCTQAEPITCYAGAWGVASMAGFAGVLTAEGASLTTWRSSFKAPLGFLSARVGDSCSAAVQRLCIVFVVDTQKVERTFVSTPGSSKWLTASSPPRSDGQILGFECASGGACWAVTVPLPFHGGPFRILRFGPS